MRVGLSALLALVLAARPLPHGGGVQRAALEPFRSRKADTLAAFFRRITTPQGVKRSFVDGCPAGRGRV